MLVRRMFGEKLTYGFRQKDTDMGKNMHLFEKISNCQYMKYI